jgi:hypothetical protein
MKYNIACRFNPQCSLVVAPGASAGFSAVVGIHKKAVEPTQQSSVGSSVEPTHDAAFVSAVVSAVVSAKQK